MKISTRTRYGLRLVCDLAENFNKGPMQLNTIAEKENISEKYLGQIIIILKNSGLVDSIRGANGGYFLNKDPEKITVREIFEILEGSIEIVPCCSEKTDCDNSSKCKTINMWKLLTKKIIETLDSVTIKDLIENKNESNMFFI